MPTALLVGAYGQGNLGDDALVDAFTSALPGWRIAATALDPTSAPSSCEVVPRRPLRVLFRALTADAVVFGGGTIFKRLHGATGRRPLSLLLTAAALVTASSAARRPVALLGVGAGDMHGRVAPALARHIVKKSDLLVVRDEESARELVDAGVAGPLRVGADPTWVLLDPPLASHEGAAKRVLVIPSRLAAGDDSQDMIERLERTLVQLLDAGMKVELRSWERSHTAVSRRLEPAPRDDALVEQLARRLAPEVEIGPTPPTLAHAVDAMRDVTVVLTFRFHGLVAAGAAGVPTVAVAHEPKLTGLARRLGQPAAPVDFDADELAHTVLSTSGVDGPDPAAVKHEIAKADEGFRLLRVLLTAGRTDESDALGALPLRLWH